MKIIAVGDLHLRDTCPTSRKDNYAETILRKLKYILDLGKRFKNEECVFVFPGDIFDTVNVPHEIIARATAMFRVTVETDEKHSIVFVYGQHDLRYHTQNTINTPLGILSHAIPGPKLVNCSNDNCLQVKNVLISGANWGVEIPKPTPIIEQKGLINICILHRAITETKLPWERDDILFVDELIQKGKDYTIFITGDNHKQFIYEKDNHIIFNMGSVGRTNIDQKTLRPAVAIIDIFEKPKNGKLYDYEFEYIPIEEDVFKEENQAFKPVVNEHNDMFAEALGKEFNAKTSFLDILQAGVNQLSKSELALLKTVIERSTV